MSQRDFLIHPHLCSSVLETEEFCWEILSDDWCWEFLSDNWIHH